MLLSTWRFPFAKFAAWFASHRLLGNSRRRQHWTATPPVWIEEFENRALLSGWASSDALSLAHSRTGAISSVTTSTLYGDSLGPVSVSISSAPTKGSVVDNGDGTFTYTATVNEVGNDSFQYGFTDNESNEFSASVTITLENYDASASTDSRTVSHSSTAQTIMTATLYGDMDGDALTVSITSVPSGFGFDDNNDGTFAVTAPTDTVGTFTFQFDVTDGFGSTASGSFTLTLDNYAPYTSTDSLAIAHAATTQTVTTTTLYGDMDGDTLTVNITSVPSGFSLTDNNDGTFDVTAPANTVGSFTFQFDVTDGFSPAVQGSFTLDLTNDAPSASSDYYEALDEWDLVVPAIFGVKANDMDMENDPFVITLATPPTYGSLTLSSDGSFTYNATDGYSGPDFFEYTATDPFTAVATAAKIRVDLLVRKIVIYVDGVPKTNGTTSLRVGELASVSIGLSPIPLEAEQLTVSIGNWANLPGKAIKSYTESDEGASYELFDATDLDGTSLNIYWTATANGLDVSASPTIANTFLGVPNPVFTAAAKHTYFNITKPTNTISATTATSVEFLPNLITFGNSSGTVGIAFSTNKAVNGEQLRYTQLITSTALRIMQADGLYYQISSSDNQLDAELDYGGDVGAVSYTTEDSPGLALGEDTRWLSVNYSFRMYLYWKSDRAGSIFVPIRYVDWSVSFAAVASVDANGVVTGWGLDPTEPAPSWTANPVSQDYNDYPPTWDGVALNDNWQQED